MSSPADGWPHFDPDERTETLLHLQARQEIEELGDSGGRDV